MVVPIQNEVGSNKSFRYISCKSLNGDAGSSRDLYLRGRTQTYVHASTGFIQTFRFFLSPSFFFWVIIDRRSVRIFASILSWQAFQSYSPFVQEYHLYTCHDCFFQCPIQFTDRYQPIIELVTAGFYWRDWGTPGKLGPDSRCLVRTSNRVHSECKLTAFPPRQSVRGYGREKDQSPTILMYNPGIYFGGIKGKKEKAQS
jgi:hypothetical protein